MVDENDNRGIIIFKILVVLGSIFLFFSILFIVLFIIKKNKAVDTPKDSDYKDFVTGFISDDKNDEGSNDNVQQSPIIKEVSEIDKKIPVEKPEEVEGTGLTADEFFSLFFPDPTKSVRNTLEFADSLVDTVMMGKYVYTKSGAIAKFFKYVGTEVGSSKFAQFVSTKLKNGAKIGGTFFKSLKNSKLVIKGSRIIRGQMVYKSISKFLTATKNFFFKMGLSAKGLFARLGVKSATFASRGAARLASTSAAKGAVNTAKSIKSAATTAYNSVKTVKTAVMASKAGVKVAQVGAKAASTAAKLSNPIGWALLVFDISSMILDFANVGGYGDIGFKSEFYKIRDGFISETNQEFLESGFVYPFIYGPNIDEDKIYENIQSRISLSIENQSDDTNDLTYVMRQNIKKDLESGILTIEMLMTDDSIITKYYEYVDSERLFRNEYDSICTNNKGEIVEIDDRFSVYDKKEKLKYNLNVPESDAIFTKSLQKCESEFSKKLESDNSYFGFSFSESFTEGEFIDFTKLNDDTFIGILEANNFMYKRKTLESPLQFVDMDLNKGLNIKMNKVIQLNDNTFVGISNFKLYTCPEFNENALWDGPIESPDKIISICELSNGEFAVIKDDYLLYTKQTLQTDALKISPVSIPMISITKNNDGTLLVIGKDNVIYTQRDMNSPQVSTGLGSVIKGFQTKDELYVFLGTDLRLYFKTSLEDKLLDPYEVMDFNCRFLKDSNMLNYTNDDESDVYTKNNNPMNKMKVCSYTKENCQSQWPPPGENDPKSEDYIYHEYKSNILGPNKGACVLRDSRMRQYCESDEVKNKYPEHMRNKTYDIESGSCLINEIYCKNRGIDYVFNKDINEYDCNTSVGQDVLEFIFGTNTTRAIQAGINKGSNAIRRLLSGEATEINCPPNTRRVADLCYDSCPPDYKSDGTNRCYKNKPSDWKGGETITHLQHDTIYSTVGDDTSKSIPMSCKPGEEFHPKNTLGLCYKNPDPNLYEYSSPGFYKGKCRPGYDRWDGSGCWKDYKSYGNGVGTIPNYSACPSDYTTFPLTCTKGCGG